MGTADTPEAYDNLLLKFNTTYESTLRGCSNNVYQTIQMTTVVARAELGERLRLRTEGGEEDATPARDAQPARTEPQT